MKKSCRYEKVEKIGEGSYGSVWKALDTSEKKTVALKICKDPFQGEKDSLSAVILREICILKQLSHPNIVRLLDVILLLDKTKLIFEFVEMDLKKALYTAKLFGPEPDLSISKEVSFIKTEENRRIRLVIRKIIEAVDYTHSRRVLHRDIKPQNILVSENLETVKLADFGLSRIINVPFREMSNEIVTLWYRAPELLLGDKNYGVSVDLWSIGCVFYELIYKKPFCRGESQADQLFKILRVLGTPKDESATEFQKLPGFMEGLPKFKGCSADIAFPGLPPMTRDLLCSFLKIDPLQRISAKMALGHSYFFIEE